MSRHSPQPAELAAPAGMRVGVVAARWNGHVTDRLLEQCVGELAELGADSPTVARVPGAFELPVAARWLGEGHDAVVCLGCVIRGDTPHFDYVAGEAARGVMQLSIDLAKPVIFGVLTVNTEAQAIARVSGEHSEAGRDAARAAVEMLALRRALPSRP